MQHDHCDDAPKDSSSQHPNNAPVDNLGPVPMPWYLGNGWVEEENDDGNYHEDDDLRFDENDDPPYDPWEDAWGDLPPEPHYEHDALLDEYDDWYPDGYDIALGLTERVTHAAPSSVLARLLRFGEEVTKVGSRRAVRQAMGSWMPRIDNMRGMRRNHCWKRHRRAQRHGKQTEWCRTA